SPPPESAQHHGEQQGERRAYQGDPGGGGHRGVVTAEQFQQQHRGADEHTDDAYPAQEHRGQCRPQRRPKGLTLQGPRHRHPLPTTAASTAVMTMPPISHSSRDVGTPGRPLVTSIDMIVSTKNVSAPSSNSVSNSRSGS